MNLRKNLAFGCCVLLIAISVAACSKTAASSESSTAEVTGSPNMGSANTQDSSTVYGKVTKISGNKITLALGSMGGGQAPNGNGNKSGGAAPSGTPGGNGNGGKSGGAAPSGTPGGNGNKSGGAAPSGTPNGNMHGGMGGGFTQNGKTSTITIKDESLIKVSSGNTETAGSLKSITKGSILTIKYTDSSKKTISQITVQGSFNGTAQGKNNTSSSSKSN